MWPLISSSRISRASPSASSGVSAKRTPPAFIRPPVKTCDLMTTGPATSVAIRLTSSTVLAKPPGATGTRSRSRIWRDSYSKNLMAARESSGTGYPVVMTLVAIIVIAVVLIGLVALLLNRRRAEQERQREIARREVAGHRQEASAHESRAEEMLVAAGEKRREAAQLNEQADDLEQKGERSMSHAERHGSVATEKEREL